MSNKTAKQAIFAHKPYSLLDASFGGRPIDIRPARTIEMSPAQYAEFISDFTADREWIREFNCLQLRRAERGELYVIAIICPGEKTLYIDPEGANYAKSVGIEW